MYSGGKERQYYPGKDEYREGDKPQDQLNPPLRKVALGLAAHV